MSDIIGITEVARMLHRDPKTIRAMVATGDLIALAYRTDNDKPQFSRTGIDAYLRRTGELAAERRTA
jgi:hypothetical protein